MTHDEALAQAAEYHEVEPGVRLAYLAEGRPDGRRCGLVWLGGFKSAMTGTKAGTLAAWARAEARSFLRFDYSGHGLSGGRFEDGTITTWLDQCVAMFTGYAPGPRIVLGSSMGGWLALLLARRLAQDAPDEMVRIRGIVLIAPAVDMTEALMWRCFPAETRTEIERGGIYMRPSRYGDGPYPVTRSLIEDGRRHLLLGGRIVVTCPVRILHGDRDPDVPWRHGLDAFKAINGDDVTFTLIKGGDHRLSDPGPLAHIIRAADDLCRRADQDSEARSAASPSR